MILIPKESITVFIAISIIEFVYVCLFFFSFSFQLVLFGMRIENYLLTWLCHPSFSHIDNEIVELYHHCVRLNGEVLPLYITPIPWM